MDDRGRDFRPRRFPLPLDATERPERARAEERVGAAIVAGDLLQLASANMSRDARFWSVLQTERQ